MFLDCVGDGHIKRVIRKRQCGGICFHKFDLWRLLRCKFDKSSILVYTDDVGVWIPAGE